MAMRILVRLSTICAISTANVAIAETLQCKDLNRRNYAIDLDVTQGGQAKDLYLSGDDMASGARLNLSRVRRESSTGRPVQLIFSIQDSDAFPDYDVEYDLADKSVIVFQTGRSGKRKIGQGKCFPRAVQELPNRSEADAKRINKVLSASLKTTLADIDSTKPVTLTFLIDTYKKIADNANDPWFYQGGVDDEPNLEALQNRPEQLSRFGLLVDTDETEYFLGGFNSYRVTGTAKQIMTAIREFEYGGKIVWAGAGSAKRAALNANDTRCEVPLRAGFRKLENLNGNT